MSISASVLAQNLQPTAVLQSIARLVQRPRNIKETGLGQKLLSELVAKHLYDLGVTNRFQLTKALALSGPVIESLLAELKQEAYVEVRGPELGSSEIRYSLTDRGRVLALEAFAKSGYLGTAPVPLELYKRLCHEQSVHHHLITKAEMLKAFSDTVIPDELLDEIGPAMHSGRPIFIYGIPGTGKTFISQRLARLLGGPIFIPDAISIGEEIVQLFDPILHKPLENNDKVNDFLLAEGYDPRFRLCERPFVVSGGELTLDMLEITTDRAIKLQQAPLQLKATNGIFLIDDLGRQRVAPVDLFNRWIVPMESRQDHLTLASGRRFAIPFDVILMFSTNLNPRDLADDAFLRRLGHKVHFTPLNRQGYLAVWKQYCDQAEITCEAGALDYLIDDLHAQHKVPMLPCHPRDLIGIVLDHARYNGTQRAVTKEALDTAWRNYFVKTVEEETVPELARNS